MIATTNTAPQTARTQGYADLDRLVRLMDAMTLSLAAKYDTSTTR